MNSEKHKNLKNIFRNCRLFNALKCKQGVTQHKKNTNKNSACKLFTVVGVNHDYLNYSAATLLILIASLFKKKSLVLKVELFTVTTDRPMH